MESANNEQEAKPTLEEVEKLYEENPKKYLQVYLDTLDENSKELIEKDELSDSVRLQEKRFELINSLYETSQVPWVKKYLEAMNGLADIYEKTDKVEESIKFKENRLGIVKELYIKTPVAWVKEYVNSLKSLADSYEKSALKDAAIQELAIRLDILKGLFETHPVAWTREYLTSLDNLGTMCLKNNSAKDAIEHYETYFKIIYEYMSDKKALLSWYISVSLKLLIAYEITKQRRSFEKFKSRILKDMRKYKKMHGKEQLETVIEDVHKKLIEISKSNNTLAEAERLKVFENIYIQKDCGFCNWLKNLLS